MANWKRYYADTSGNGTMQKKTPCRVASIVVGAPGNCTITLYDGVLDGNGNLGQQLNTSGVATGTALQLSPIAPTTAGTIVLGTDMDWGLVVSIAGASAPDITIVTA